MFTKTERRCILIAARKYGVEEFCRELDIHPQRLEFVVRGGYDPQVEGKIRSRWAFLKEILFGEVSKDDRGTQNSRR